MAAVSGKCNFYSQKQSKITFQFVGFNVYKEVVAEAWGIHRHNFRHASALFSAIME